MGRAVSYISPVVKGASQPPKGFASSTDAVPIDKNQIIGLFEI
jgi:hypothetical protein